MTTPTKATYDNQLSSQDRQAKAIERAKEQLLSEGVKYPYYDHSLTADENYTALLRYSAREAHLVVQFMKEPSGPRPIEEINVIKPTKRHWGTPYRDD